MSSDLPSKTRPSVYPYLQIRRAPLNLPEFALTTYIEMPLCSA